MFPEFFQTYFVNPILNISGYNWVNTFVYALILILAVFLVYKLLKFLKIKIDGKFALSLAPYILLGSVLRVLRDAGFFTSPVFVSPLLYILVFIITLFFLLFSLFLEKTLVFQRKTVHHLLFSEGKKRPLFVKQKEGRGVMNGTKICFQSYFFSFGFILSGIFFTQIQFINFTAAVQILGLDLLIFILVFSLGNLTKLTKSLFNKFVIFSQLFDASSTFVGVRIYHHAEQHVVPNLLFDLSGNIWSFFIVKFIVAILLLYVIDNYIEDKNFRNWLKIVVIILGFALGTRDLFQIMCF